LSQLQVLGLKSNVAYLRRVLTHPDHVAGDITTRFIEEHPDLLPEPDAPLTTALIAAAVGRQQSATISPLHNHWRNNAFRPICESFKHAGSEHTVLLTPMGEGHYLAEIGGQTFNVYVWSYDNALLSLSIDGHRQPITLVQGQKQSWWIFVNGYSTMLTWVSPLPEGGRMHAAEGSLHAPMPGQIRAVHVTLGQQVNEGDVLLILEAMKMEHRIKAPYTGEVVALHYQVGQSVQADAVLLELKSNSD
ncbi:MAG: biotin/lipoyl-binding protein, partial [Anaerolineae bacterium]|nr:biotin/lipoyl-binding protein [Anaerolineae bacterium]